MNDLNGSGLEEDFVSLDCLIEGWMISATVSLLQETKRVFTVHVLLVHCSMLHKSTLQPVLRQCAVIPSAVCEAPWLG
jgi:hypothetical protein